MLHEGVERVYDLNVQPLHDRNGRVDGVTCAAIDITDTKRSEEALRTRNERLRLLSTTASQLVLRSTALQLDTDNILSGVFDNVARTLRVEMHLHYRVVEPGGLRLISSSGLSDEIRTGRLGATVRREPVRERRSDARARSWSRTSRRATWRRRARCARSASGPTPGSRCSPAAASWRRRRLPPPCARRSSRTRSR